MNSFVHSAVIGSLLLFGACAEPGDTLDPENGSFSGPKADGFCAAEGSPEGNGILQLVNDPAVSADELDRTNDGAGLHGTAANNIVANRPYATLADLDAVSFVGSFACERLRSYACEEKELCEAAGVAGTIKARLQFTYFGDNDTAELEALGWNIDDPFEPFFDVTVDVGALPQSVTVLDGSIDDMSVRFSSDGTVSADFNNGDNNSFAAVQMPTRTEGAETRLDIDRPLTLFIHGNDNSQFSIDGTVSLTVE